MLILQGKTWKKKNQIKIFIDEIKNFCNINISEDSTTINNNYFLREISNNNSFFRLSLEKLKRIYKTYENDTYKIKVIKNAISNLFTNNWQGAYNELTTYDFLNLLLDSPCYIQIDNIEKSRTLVEHFNNKKVSTIDGFSRDTLTYFEIKTLRKENLIEKIKFDIYKEHNNVVIKADNSLDLKLPNDNCYSDLKNEISNAINNKVKVLHSNIVKGLRLEIIYDNVQELTMEFHRLCSPFELAEQMEDLPIEKAYQFIDGSFIKIFVISQLNFHRQLFDSKEFFRSIARRVFCRLTKDESIYNTERNHNFENSKLKVSDVAKKLNGLMFLVDISTQENIDISNPIKSFKTYLYSNPNTPFKNKFLGFRNFCIALSVKRILTDSDDFEHDNY